MQLAYPISIAVVASSISILIWVWFWTRKQSLDNKSAIFVFVGGAIAVLFALPFQKAFSIFIPGSPPIVLFFFTHKRHQKVNLKFRDFRPSDITICIKIVF